MSVDLNHTNYIFFNEVNNITYESLRKECSDFKYQETAQQHFERYPEQKHLDSDRDGYACDNLTRLDSKILTPAIWRELVDENIQRKQSTKNQESLSYSEVVRIIGFSPNNSSGSRRVWEDPINNMAIKILFRDQQILEMSGSGF